MQPKLSKIKTLFLKRMLFSLIAQLIFIGLVIITVKYYMKANVLNSLSDTLLITDDYSTDLIASYIELNENYALQLELHNLGEMRELDSVEFTNYLPDIIGTANKKKIYSQNDSYVTQFGNDDFQGVTVISYRGKKLGYILTKKQYKSLAEASVSYDLFLVLITSCFAFILNFIFLFLSLKNRIMKNTSQLIEATISSNAPGNPLNIDINEYRLLADKIIFAKNENLALLKQKALAETAASVAHDIRSPLAVMEIHLNKIQSTSLTEHINALKQAVSNIRGVANNLLNRYRDKSNELLHERLHINEDDGQESRITAIQPLMTDLANEKSNEWQPSSVNFEINLTDISPFSLVNLQPVGFKRVLSNLINNAFEAAPLNGYVHLNVQQLDNNVFISIKDNGIGIPPSLINSVLSGKSTKHNGKGLGLSTAVDFMQQISGTLKINSAENIGTEVTLIAPVINPPHWYPQKIFLQYDSTIICAITDPTLLVTLQKRLSQFFVNLKLYSSHLDALSALKTIASHHHITLFLDSIPLDHSNINIDFYLISDNPNNLIVQNYVRENNAKLIPKSLIEIIPILES